MGLSNWQNKIRRQDLFIDIECLSVHDFIFQNNNWVWITDSSLQESLGIYKYEGYNWLLPRIINWIDRCTYRVIENQQIPRYKFKKSITSSIPRWDDLQTRYGSIPSSKALRMLSSDTCSSTVRTTKDDRTCDGTTRHVTSLGSRVDDLIDSLYENKKIKKVPKNYSLIQTISLPAWKSWRSWIHRLAWDQQEQHRQQFQQNPFQ